jgi:hypothetical protein
MKKIRTLKANEIECRPQSVKDGKVTLLLYIDSRAATDLLDETYGMENWTIEYKDVAGQIYGRLSVYDVETNRWVYREDTGSPANIEKEKSLASDIIKRCIVRLGVTELYSSPKITIDDDKYGNSGYKVSEIEYDTNRNITHLVLVNRFGKEVYRWDKNNANQPTKYKAVINQTQDKLEWEDEQDNLTKLTEFCKKKTEEGENRSELGKFFKYYSNRDFKGQMNVERLWMNWSSRIGA